MLIAKTSESYLEVPKAACVHNLPAFELAMVDSRTRCTCCRKRAIVNKLGSNYNSIL